MNALFLTNKKDIISPIPGGVQLCSMEYRDALVQAGFTLHDFYVDFTRKMSFRLKRKLKIDAYNLYETYTYKRELATLITKTNAEFVFVNKSELIRFSEIIKDINPLIRVVILSHGNETGDFLHMLTRPSKIHPFKNKLAKIFRLGYNLFIESYYRTRYVDTVFTLSDVEMEIEKWLGVHNVLMVPRIFKPDFIDYRPDKTSVGFVGTLNHPPNYQGLIALARELLKIKSTCNIKIVGAPIYIGKELEREYPNIIYLGRLSEEHLKNEMCTWSFFLNPVLWYSRGASTKLAVGINAGIPIISSKAGNRGYTWKEGTIIECESENEMALFIDGNFKIIEKLNHLADEVKKVALSGPTESQIAYKMKENLIRDSSH